MNGSITINAWGSVFTKYILKNHLYHNQINCVKHVDSGPPQAPEAAFQEDEHGLCYLFQCSHSLPHSAMALVWSEGLISWCRSWISASCYLFI